MSISNKKGTTKPTKPMKRKRKKTGIKATARSITMRTEYFAKLKKLAEDAGYKTTGRWIEAQIDKEMGGE